MFGVFLFFLAVSGLGIYRATEKRIASGRGKPGEEPLYWVGIFGLFSAITLVCIHFPVGLIKEILRLTDRAFASGAVWFAIAALIASLVACCFVSDVRDKRLRDQRNIKTFGYAGRHRPSNCEDGTTTEARPARNRGSYKSDIEGASIFTWNIAPPPPEETFFGRVHANETYTALTVARDCFDEGMSDTLCTHLCKTVEYDKQCTEYLIALTADDMHAQQKLEAPFSNGVSVFEMPEIQRINAD